MSGECPECGEYGCLGECIEECCDTCSTSSVIVEWSGHSSLLECGHWNYRRYTQCRHCNTFVLVDDVLDVDEKNEYLVLKCGHQKMEVKRYYVEDSGVTVHRVSEEGF